MVTKREMSRYSSKPPPSWAQNNDLAALLEQGRPENVGMAVANRPTVTPPFNPARSLAEMMDPNILYPGGQRTPTPPQRQQNPLASILAQIQSLLGGNREQYQMPRFQPMQLPTFDPNRYKKQAEASVNAEFNPIINEIYSQQAATKQRSATNRASARNDYNAMVASIGQDLNATTRSYDATQAESKKLYEDERNRIAAGYAADAAAQRAAARRLGTEALGVNEAIAEQDADKNFAQQMGSQQMQSSQGALGMQQAAAEDYDRAIQGATRAEGAEVQQDLMAQLEDYMSQSNTNLAQTRSQAAQSVNDLALRLAQAAYERDTQNTQFGYQQQRDFISDQNALFDRGYGQQQDQLELALKLMEMQGASGAGAEEKLNPWQNAATFAEQLRPGQGSGLIAAIQGSMSRRPEIFARDKEDPVPMNPALFAKLIAEDPANSGLDRNSLMMVANEIYRLLYGVS